MSKPRGLDLMCGEGGCSVGYAAAGFDMTGVDIEPQPRYPYRFIQADARDVDLSGYDFIHASPICKGLTVANNIHQREYENQIPWVRERLIEWGGPYIIENVPGARAHLRDYVTVCGLGLGLNVKRHRLFESNLALFGVPCPKGHPGDWLLVFGNSVLSRGHEIGRTAKNGLMIRRKEMGIRRGRAAMGNGWMTREGLSQSIPWRYTYHLGVQAVKQVLIPSSRKGVD